MATFEYRAVHPSGKMLAGAMEAASPAEVLDRLDRAGCTPIFAREAKAGARRSWRELLTPEPPREHVTGFTLDLAMMLKGGVALDEALGILAEMESRRWLAALIRALRDELAAGKSLSAALALHPKAFPPVYVQTVAVAESAGRLEAALADLAAERQRGEKLRKKAASAVTYPAFLLVAALAVLCFVMLYVVPQFEGALMGFRSRLEPSTLFVFDLSRAFRTNLDLIGAGAAALLALGLVASRLSRQGSWLVRLLARLPLTRTILGYELAVAFCRTLSILLANGVPITTALKLVRDVVRPPQARAAIDLVIADVRQGDRVAASLARRAFLPAHVVQMLRVGEEAGQLADSAGRVATFYEVKLDAALGRLTAIVGPATMVVVACLVAWLIISVMSALVSINDLLV
ncbi:type II secretion system F family protein [Methylopila turkensis]|nr:type II secretion system F family protein [Methylopila turkensis]